MSLEYTVVSCIDKSFNQSRL